MLINRINALLILVIVILSFLTIYWHNQSHLLYKKITSVQQNNQFITAKQKQLLSEYSEQMSGNKIQKKAITKLRMQRPVKIRVLNL